jgi:hypothetical protein
VLTLNQVVLSQELGAAGDQRERMEGALAFREEVAALLDEPAAPAEPSAFLRALLEATADRARALEGEYDDADRLVRAVTEDADRAARQLEGASFGTFDVLSAVLDFNYSRKLYEARRLEARETSEPMAELSEALELFGPAREHFKTLYVQSELIALSRAVSAAALPALVVAVSVLTLVDPAAVGVRAGVDLLAVVVAGGVTVSLAPFLVLLAYVVRIATVTGRTLSIGPFVLRETDRSTDA